MLHLPELEALPEDIDPKRTRDLIKEIGSVQFCDLIPAMDALTNFSEICAGEFPGDVQVWRVALRPDAVERDTGQVGKTGMMGADRLRLDAP